MPRPNSNAGSRHSARRKTLRNSSHLVEDARRGRQISDDDIFVRRILRSTLQGKIGADDSKSVTISFPAASNNFEFAIADALERVLFLASESFIRLGVATFVCAASMFGTEFARPEDVRSITRRAFLKNGFALAGTASVVALSGCATAATEPLSTGTVFPQPRPLPQTAGPVREFRRVAEMGEVEVGPGMVYRTWLYNGRFPGEEIRVREGERLRVILENRLPEGTTIHWHGVPVPNAMDGVAGITQAPVAPGQTFVYEFVAGPPGSYMYHSHQGLQIDRGLFGSLVIEESTPHIQWDREYTVILDDFLPGEPGLSGVGVRGPMGGMRRGMGGMGGMMGNETPLYGFSRKRAASLRRAGVRRKPRRPR